MRCDYCYSPPSGKLDMTKETASKAIEYASKLSPVNTGIIFFGGEPLLKKDLIKSTIQLCKRLSSEKGYSYHFKVTTNGLLLDEPFMKYANAVGLTVALSLDGNKDAHDKHRKGTTGRGTFDTLEPKIDLLLKYQPYASVLMVITPETVQYYTESVKYLVEKGFRYIIASLNYAGNWTEKEIKELKKQYLSLAKLYEKWTLKQKKFYFSPFEVKFATHIKGEESLCERCQFGKRQVSIAPDGTIYPCVQFVKDGVSNKEYSIGNVRDGIDEVKRENLFNESLEQEEICRKCAVNKRCNNNCSCLNWQTTGFINSVSPVLCETEKIIIPIVDKLGERLYKKRAPMFIQKHYNAVYPILSLLDDNN